jgi:DnaJ like chaperone protein
MEAGEHRMGIFSRIAATMAGGAGRIGAAVSGLRAVLGKLASSEVRREAAFAVAMIALSAKMAKADGVVTSAEVDAFCRIFTIPPGEERNVSRVYNLAKRDIAGFEAYAREVAHLLADEPDMLEAVLDGLFDIARADGAVHERELAYLARVADLFGFDAHAFARVRARHVVEDGVDPYLVLDADPSWDYQRLQRHYRQLVVENHPDRLIAHGMPEEFVRIANDRLAAVNAAWERVDQRRARA